MEGVVPESLVLRDLGSAAAMTPDLIVEVAHPSIVAEYGTLFLQIADFMVCRMYGLTVQGNKVEPLNIRHIGRIMCYP